MATFVQQDPLFDKTKNLVEDNERNRVIAMENIAHDNMLNEPMWKARQNLTYKNLIKTTNDVDLGYLLSQENEKQQEYYVGLTSNGLKLLSSICGKVSAKFILASLAIHELEYLIQQFLKIVKDYHSLYGKKIDKELFITFVRKRYSARSNENFKERASQMDYGSNLPIGETSFNNNDSDNSESDVEMDVEDDFFTVNEVAEDTSYIYNSWQPQNNIGISIGANEQFNYQPQGQEDSEIREQMLLAEMRAKLQQERDRVLQSSQEASNIYANGLNNINNENIDAEMGANVYTKMEFENLQSKRGREDDDIGNRKKHKDSFLPPADRISRQLYNQIFKEEQLLQQQRVENRITELERGQSRRREGQRRQTMREFGIDDTERRKGQIVENMEAERNQVEREQSSLKERRQRQIKREMEAEKLYKILKQGPKRKLFGRGVSRVGEHKTSRIHRFYMDKYYVDLKKLGNNVLCVKYSLNDAFVPSLKVQRVSNAVRDLINDILENKYNTRIFQMLTDNEKRVVKRFVSACKLDVEIDKNLDDEFQRNFEVLLGEYQSGNDSPQVKKELKKYIMEALQENKIPKSQAMLLLYELSL